MSVLLRTDHSQHQFVHNIRIKILNGSSNAEKCRCLHITENGPKCTRTAGFGETFPVAEAL